MELGKQIQQAIEVLHQGGIVAFPTDTVYGLGAHPFLERAVERVFEVKSRPRDRGLPLLLAEVAQLADVARSIPDLAWRLAEGFLPGGLTLVLWKALSISGKVTGGSDKVALRIPDHPVPLALVRGLGAPLIGTSANLAGRPSPLTAVEVRRQLGKGVDLIIDGGGCPVGVASTVLDLTGELPVILREGTLTREEIEKVCQTTVVTESLSAVL